LTFRYQIASGTGRPYVDYEVEHPVGTLLVFKALAAPPQRSCDRQPMRRGR